MTARALNSGISFSTEESMDPSPCTSPFTTKMTKPQLLLPAGSQPWPHSLLCILFPFWNIKMFIFYELHLHPFGFLFLLLYQLLLCVWKNTVTSKYHSQIHLDSKPQAFIRITWETFLKYTFLGPMFLRLGNLGNPAVAHPEHNIWESMVCFSTPLPLFPHSTLLPMFFENVINYHKIAKSKSLFLILILTHHTIAFNGSGHLLILEIALIGQLFFLLIFLVILVNIPVNISDSLLQLLFQYLTLKIKIFSQFLGSTQCSSIWKILPSPLSIIYSYL